MSSASRKVLVSILLGFAVIASIVGTIVLLVRIDLAQQREVDWWAPGDGAAKFVSALFIVCLPLIATKAHAEGTAASEKPPRRSRRTRRA